MSWLAVLLVGIAVADLGHSVRPVRWLPECVGAVVTVVVGLLAGLHGGRDLVAVAAIAGVVLLWGRTVAWGFGRGRAWVPLAVLGGAVAVLVMLSPAASPAGGLLQEWLDRGPLPVLAGREAEEVLAVLSVLLVQLSTGNVVVRLVLSATGTLDPTGQDPARQDPAADPAARLKGGRLLGPMERLFILGLGLAGQLTAAAIVIAAKGLLRFPELQSKSEQQRIHQLTEYFLVGSFVSWLVALGSLVLVAG